MSKKDPNLRGPKKGEPGSYEWHNKQYYSSVEPEGPRGRTHIVSPALAFKTEKEPVVVLRGMLRILSKHDFSGVIRYEGPDVGVPRNADGGMPTDDLVHALEDVEGGTPPFMGFRCVLAYDGEDDVVARIKVSGHSKAKLKVKGTIPRSTWDRLRKDIKRKYHLKV